MFVWRADKIMKNINTLMPELNLRLRKIDASWGTAKQDAVLQSEWLGIVPQTIDYGIMEHARDVAVLPAEDLHWSDVGSWDSLYEVSTRDENGNAAVNTDHKAIDSYNSLILTSENKLVVTLGVKDLVIIDTGDSLLICNRHNAQDVRKVIDWLKSEKKNQYL